MIKERVGYYSFRREVGQRVAFKNNDVKGTVVSVEPYYTLIDGDDGYFWAGEPWNIYPIREEKDA